MFDIIHCEYRMILKSNVFITVSNSLCQQNRPGHFLEAGEERLYLQGQRGTAAMSAVFTVSEA